MRRLICFSAPTTWLLLLSPFSPLHSHCLGQPTFSAGLIAGVVEPDNVVIVEGSGLAASRRNPNVYWTHNDRMGLDTGTTPEIYAIDDTGRLLGTYTLPQPPAVLHDFEDIALGPGPVAGVSYLYVGDVGDTITSHPDPADNIIYRIPEPAVTASQIPAGSPLNKNLKGVEAITLHFPDARNHNCETMMVDPITGDLFVITKANYASPGQPTVTDSRLFRTAAADLIAGQVNPLQLVGDITALPQAIPGDRTTGGDISANGSEILVRTYRHVFLWQRDVAAGQSIGDALVNGTPIRVPLSTGPATPDIGTAIPPTVSVGGAGAQGESVAFDAVGLNYVSHSENNGSARPLYRYDRTTPGPVVPQLLVPPGATWEYLHDGTDPGVDWRDAGVSTGWASGPAQIGYGDGDQATNILPGGDPANKPLGAFFRHEFNVADPAAFGWLIGRLIFDDGAAVYVNGIEAARFRLAPGAAWDDPASSQQLNELEDAWFEFAMPANALVAGSNVIAVEVHQILPSSSDLSFDFQLLAGPPVGSALITRIIRPTPPGNQVRLFYQAPVGFRPMMLERTPSLAPPAWQGTANFTAGSELGFPYIETPAPAVEVRQFYRLLFEP